MCVRLDLLIRGLSVIGKKIPHNKKTDTCWGWCVLIGFVKSHVTIPAYSSHWTSAASAYHHQRSSCCGVSFSQVGTIPCADLVHCRAAISGQEVIVFGTSATGDTVWASCQIRKIAGAHAPGMPGTFSPSPQVSDPDMHHGTCVTHVPWCMPGSVTSGFIWNRRRGKTFPAFPAHAQPAILRIW